MFAYAVEDVTEFAGSREDWIVLITARLHLHLSHWRRLEPHALDRISGDQHALARTDCHLGLRSGLKDRRSS